MFTKTIEPILLDTNLLSAAIRSDAGAAQNDSATIVDGRKPSRGLLWRSAHRYDEPDGSPQLHLGPDGNRRSVVSTERREALNSTTRRSIGFGYGGSASRHRYPFAMAGTTLCFMQRNPISSKSGRPNFLVFVCDKVPRLFSFQP